MALLNHGTRSYSQQTSDIGPVLQKQTLKTEAFVDSVVRVELCRVSTVGHAEALNPKPENVGLLARFGPTVLNTT